MNQDEFLKEAMVSGMRNGTIRTPEMIMKERIRLRIPPRVVSEKFREAYKRYKDERMK